MSGHGSGKVILVGEHVVVYGVPALVVGIERGADADAVAAEDGVSSLTIGDGAPIRPGDGTDAGRGFAGLLAACGVTRAVRVHATTDLPAAAGLGCSAALGVAVVRALDQFGARAKADADDVATRALAWETVFHGNPSGVDVAAAARGGCFRFRRTESGPVIDDVPIARPLTLAIGHTGVASSTKAMVEGVARLRERRPEIFQKSLDGIAALVGNARLAIETGDLGALGHLMNLAQFLLAGLMVSTEEIETMCRAARDAGALGAKLTGAGGGGCVVALVEGDATPVLEAWRERGFDGFATTVCRGAGGDA